MTTVATIIFKSGIAVEVPMGAVQAQALLDGFDESWDEEGPQIALPMSAASSGVRLIGSEIVGIIVSDESDGDENADDHEDEEDEDDEDEDDLDEEDDEDEDDIADVVTEDADDLADAEAGKVA